MAGEPSQQHAYHDEDALQSAPLPSLALPDPQISPGTSNDVSPAATPKPRASEVSLSPSLKWRTHGPPSPRRRSSSLGIRTPDRPSRRKSSFAAIQSALDRDKLVTEFFTVPRTRWDTTKPQLLMGLYFFLGLVLSFAHVAFYVSLKDRIVGGPQDQERNIQVGTALAFLSQITLTASVWRAYTQWLWWTMAQRDVTVKCLDAAFGADTSIFKLMSWELLRDFKIGFAMGLVAWGLILPPFFTPATLFVYPSSRAIVESDDVLQLAISDPKLGASFAYSPPAEANTTHFENDTSRIFNGPRTIMTLLSTATAASGQILPIEPRYNESSYSVQFYGPIVKCEHANSTAEALIDSFLAAKMNQKIGTAVESDNAYYGFVPHYNEEGLFPIAEPLPQGPSNGTNEFWMIFSRWQEGADPSDRSAKPDKFRQVCRLYNATYDLDMKWDRGFQEVKKNYDILNEVPFPKDAPGIDSDMVVHAYSAFFWALTDQLVGTLSWYEEEDQSKYPPQFGVIDTPIKHNALLGSSDLDVFFTFSQRLYEKDTDPDVVSPQRAQDKALAKERPLAVLIEELSFNLTVSLMHNDLLCHNITTDVTRVEAVNKYGYLIYGLVIPYALSNLCALVAVSMGAYLFFTQRFLGDKSFSTIAKAGRDPELAIEMGKKGTTVRVHLDKSGPVVRPKKGKSTCQEVEHTELRQIEEQ